YNPYDSTEDNTYRNLERLMNQTSKYLMISRKLFSKLRHQPDRRAATAKLMIRNQAKQKEEIKTLLQNKIVTRVTFSSDTSGQLAKLIDEGKIFVAFDNETDIGV
nr:glycoprotein 118 BC - Trypanosoma brucei [Trypanosoma brucei]